MTSDPEAAIRRVFDNWFAGTSSRDIDRVMQGIAHDIVSYEHDVPLQYTGIDAVRSVCQRGLDMSGPGTEWCVPETTILVRDDIAVQWGLNRMRFSAENGSPGESWSRGTRVFHKGTDGWEMVHQHVSYPYEPQTGQARTDLSPGTPAKADDESGSPSADSAEGEVRQTIERWVKAVQARDLEAVTANHTADVSMFDVPPPVVHRGLEAYRGTWPAFFEWQRKAAGRFEITSLEVTAGEDVAFAVAVLRCGSQAALAVDDTPTLRLTLGLKREDGRWMIAHEHHSFPLETDA